MTAHRLGIIQSRGLGDLIIALPIAGYYHDRGSEIIWPILSEFVPSMRDLAPWVQWEPVPYDRPGRYFYDVPEQRLADLGCDDVLCLYQALTGHSFHEEPYFQHTSFDQYKYIRAGVPFLKKWELSRYITRNPEREQQLYSEVVKNPDYVVVHLEGSDHRATYNPEIVPKDWQTIEIQARAGYNLQDWLGVIEGAQSIIMVDSVYANLVDQLQIGEDRYFIPRSHIGLTPVQGQHWHWL